MKQRFRISIFLFSLLAAPLLQVAAADWPMFRADAKRSGYTAEPIPNQLKLRWTFRSPNAPSPAWPTSERIHFDRAFQPIIMGDQILFGSSVDDQLRALDANTGQVRWTFFTESPIRFAPAGWKDRVFLASDDGWIYALNLADGKLLWKHRGGPTDEMVIGNERMTSKWPARGGPVVLGDIVYFAAGVWPSDGVYLHALDAQTGKPLWTNDETGQLLMNQPHGGAQAESGVSAQGYLTISDDGVIVPTGRAVPAVFNRTDGKLLYYHLQKNQQRGGSRAMAADRFIFNDGCLFDLKSGDLSSQVGHGALVAIPNGIVRANGRSLVRYSWKDVESKDRKGKPVKTRKLVENRLISMDREIHEFIIADREAICGEDGRISAVDYAGQRTIWWSHEVEGKVLGLAAANGRVVASTDKGLVYCFDGEPGSPNPPAAQKLATKSASTIDYAKAAKEILTKTELHEGFVVDLAAGNGELALELARQSKLHIYAIESDPKKVAAARQRLAAAGLYGVRVTVHQGDPAKAPYPKHFANLIISSGSLSGTLDAELKKEAHRLQRPYGGKICFGKLGQMKVETRGDLVGSGSWTHQNSNPANTLCSDDLLLKGPLSMFWFRDVEFEVPNRHGQGPAPLYHKGFMVVGGVDGLCCIDAYNGRQLWIYDLKGHLEDYDGIHHDVGVGETGGSFCLGDDSVYIRTKDRCLRIELATGKLLGEFKTPVSERDVNRNWGYLAYHQGTLFGSVANQQHRVSPRYKLTQLRTESVLFFAMDATTGAVKWSHKPKGSLRHNAIAISGDQVYLVDRPIIEADHVANPRRNGKHIAKLAPDKIPSGALLALNAATGKEIWRNDDNVFGTQLSVSETHSILLMNYQAVRHKFFALPSEIGGRLAGYDIATGKQLWDQEAKYQTRPVINDDTIYAQGGAWNLKTGEPIPWEFNRSYGCGQISASRHLMLFRSATLGYLDLTRGSGTENYGGIRPSCWINAIPAGGMALVPDGSSKCRCSYQMKAWFALQERN
jgi:outer membrane protein assembly factor BamB